MSNQAIDRSFISSTDYNSSNHRSAWNSIDSIQSIDIGKCFVDDQLNRFRELFYGKILIKIRNVNKNRSFWIDK